MSVATSTHLSPMASKARTPRSMRDKGAPSPNYFNPLVSPQSVPSDSQSSLEAFRKQSESNNFSLSHGNLSFFSSGSGSRNASVERSPASRSQDEHTLPPFTKSKLVPATTEKETQTVSPMDVDAPSPPTSLPPPAKPFNLQSPKGDSPSFFDIPRKRSPFTASPADLAARNRPSLLDERHPRNSLPHNRVDPPSPAGRGPVQRAETLPSCLSTDTPNLVSPQEVLDILDSYPPDDVMLLDVRVAPQYSQSRVDGALNLCIPTTLLKRPAFNVQRLADTFNREKEKAKFAKWKETKIIVAYDTNSVMLKDAASSINTLKKFTNEGWHGSSCIVRGGYSGFSAKFPDSIDRRPASEMESTHGRKLSIDSTKTQGAPVAGGCMMPAEQSSANPFFGTIRQNMDLIGGVGQFPIQIPSYLKKSGNLKDSSRGEGPGAKYLPPWLKRASSSQNRGKDVADYFLEIEKGEQQRMQKALTGTVHYGSPNAASPNSVKIAGIEKGTKNRYKDMLPYDHSRVRLQNVPAGECDYINASHIKSSYSGRHYIASQAPVPATMEDFWRVVWEQDVHLIVMLTAEHDGGQRKSHPYWEGTYGKYTVTISSTRVQTLEPSKLNIAGAEDEPNVLIREINVNRNGTTRRISQLHFSSWPDFGVPTDPAHLLSLVQVSRREEQRYAAAIARNRDMPVLVHCSAGCGRTGTFCAVDSVVATLEARLREKWPEAKDQPTWTEEDETEDLVAKTVEDFRLQRLSMVQTLRQFVLCYESVLVWFAEWLQERRGEERQDEALKAEVSKESLNRARLEVERVKNPGFDFPPT